MIKIAALQMNPFGENTYLLMGDNKDCIVVDAGCSSPAEKERLATFVEKNSLKPVLALNTHAHIDHVCAVQWIKETYGVEFALHADDIQILAGMTSYAEGLGFGDIGEAPLVERVLTDGDSVSLGSDTIKIIHTPGHTAGGVCLWIESQNMLITGDTLFRESIGRTDLPTGDYKALMSSIVGKLLPLGSEVTFFPGHGGQSTIGYEIQRNPFITEVMSGDANFSK